MTDLGQSIFRAPSSPSAARMAYITISTQTQSRFFFSYTETSIHTHVSTEAEALFILTAWTLSEWLSLVLLHVNTFTDLLKCSL